MADPFVKTNYDVKHKCPHARQIPKVAIIKVKMSKFKVPIKRSHKEHAYEIRKPHSLPFNRYGQRLFFENRSNFKVKNYGTNRKVLSLGTHISFKRYGQC
jgi:hypothetical protein